MFHERSLYAIQAESTRCEVEVDDVRELLVDNPAKLNLLCRSDVRGLKRDLPFAKRPDASLSEIRSELRFQR